MTLASYLEIQKITASEFARLVGTSRQNVSRWVNGQSIPGADDMREIARITSGSVTPNDFFGVGTPAAGDDLVA